MLSVISPAKTLDFESDPLTRKHSSPAYLKHSKQLIQLLRACSEGELCKLMSISTKLAALNRQRYQTWSPPFTPENAKQALLAFKGDVYTGFQLTDYQSADYAFAQKHLRILSGLYGLLRPLDLIQPYRLEMGTKLRTREGADLYAFWDDKIASAIEDDLEGHDDRTVVNLASNEYFKSVKTGELPGTVITPAFKEIREGKAKMISFMAKRARGMMARFIVEGRLDRPEGMKDFTSGGYRYDPSLSTDATWTFTR